MASGVDAVIAALRVVLDEAQKSEEPFWKVETANRWVGHLPRSWSGRRRWRKLVLKGDSSGEARREEFVAHVRATLAFLELNRQQIPASRKWWPLRRRGSGIPAGAGPTVATAPSPARPVNLLRVRKPMPGLH
jgi:hypothetical protein